MGGILCCSDERTKDGKPTFVEKLE
jgi:hypothetical protein